LWLDVADHCGAGGRVQADHVVEVAADLHAVRGGQVPAGHVEARERGERVGQQRLLQAVREVLLRVVEPGPVQRLGDQAGQGRQHRALVGGEQVRVLVGQGAAADGPAGDDQRQERPRLFAAHHRRLG
jgi:hypothetical protein